jgi:hypothetical protein
MKSMKNKLVIGIVAVVVLVGAYFFPQGNTVVERVVEKTVGAVAGPESTNPYVSINGLQTWSTGKRLNTATSTACAIKSPAATSTIEFTSLQINTASSTATTWRVSTSTDGFATTTSLNYFALASGAQGSYVLMSTSSNAYLIAKPNTYLVWSVEGTVISGTANFQGTCTAEFKVL